MKKSEFITLFAEKSKKSKVECEAFLNVFYDVALGVLSSKETVPLGVLGQIKYKKNAERTCKMIKTGELKKIPEKGTASLVLSKSAKETLSKIV